MAADLAPEHDDGIPDTALTGIGEDHDFRARPRLRYSFIEPGLLLREGQLLACS